MPTVTVLPHTEICPQGLTFEAQTGENLLRVLLQHEIIIEHACEMQCACATCHVFIRGGMSSIPPPSEQEEKMLDRAWGLEMDSRLSCQVIIGRQDLIVEIPKYSANYGMR